MKDKFKLGVAGWITVTSAFVFFACSSLRHALFRSAAWDLGIFDQAVYLISQGKSPVSSFMGFHILGDHAAFVFYPLALLYKIYPDVHWLLAVQAVALAVGVLPTWSLALQAGLKETQALAIAVVYLFYPLVFNINLFDFHPEVLALPAFLAVILAARLGRIWWFCLGVIFILSCKAVLSLTVAAMGVWMLVFEKRRLYGAIALTSGITWFIVATGVIIPFFGGEVADVARHIPRYRYLGNSFPEMLQNLLFKPDLILGKIFSLSTLEYLALLLLPIIWGLSPRHLAPLVGAIPTLILNILSDVPAQRSLTNQYSLPCLPFLLLATISTLAAGRGLLQNKRAIILWSLVAFLALAKFGYFWSRYIDSIDTWQATREAVAKVDTKGNVLTTHDIAPHLTHRPVVKLAAADFESNGLFQFEYVLLNLRHPGFGSSPQVAASLLAQLKKLPEFQLTYQRDQIYLFVKGNREWGTGNRD